MEAGLSKSLFSSSGDTCCVVVLPTRSGSEALLSAAVSNASPVDGDSFAPFVYSASPLAQGGWSHVWVTRARAVDTSRCAALLDGSERVRHSTADKPTSNTISTRILAVSLNATLVAESFIQGKSSNAAALLSEVRDVFEGVTAAMARMGIASPRRVLIIGGADVLSPRGDLSRARGARQDREGANTDSLSEAQCAALLCLSRGFALALGAALVAAPEAATIFQDSSSSNGRAHIAGVRALLRGGIVSGDDEVIAAAASAALGTPHRAFFTWDGDDRAAAASSVSPIDANWASGLFSKLVETSLPTLNLIPPSFSSGGSSRNKATTETRWECAAEAAVADFSEPGSQIVPSLESWASSLTLATPARNSRELSATATSANEAGSAKDALGALVTTNAPRVPTTVSAGVGPRRSLGGGRLSMGGVGVTSSATSAAPPLPPPQQAAKDAKSFFTNLLADGGRPQKRKN